jgi:hypothetical protein
MTMTRIDGWRECFEALDGLLAGSDPILLGRIGGSDTDAIAAMLEATGAETSRRTALAHLQRVKILNGYYDLKNNEATYFAYLEYLKTSYLRTKYLSFGGVKLMTMYFPENLNARFRLDVVPLRQGLEALVAGIDEAQGEWLAFPYTFFETLRGNWNLFRVFEKSLAGRRVLVASPFGKSILANWGNRASFLRDFRYPDFEMKVLDTPITYAGLPREMYPHSDWLETLGYLKNEMEKFDFEIALLSCGSYAMPLGLHARDVMKKKAVYVGGILQLFFGVIGRRYENPFFLDVINKEAYIRPLEGEKFFRHVSAHAQQMTEAFGAYF